MKLAIDPATGDKARPNIGARALCPYCAAPMAAKCGAVMEWHWAHIGPPCVEWETAFDGPVGGPSVPNEQEERGVCARCRWMSAGACRTRDPRAVRWFAAWADKAGRPQCPAYAVGSPVFVEPVRANDCLPTATQCSMFGVRKK